MEAGCGNGAMLVELAEEGFTNLHGFDYSEKGIELAKEFATKSETVDINYFAADLFNMSSELNVSYNVILDKGTFDAIALASSLAENTGDTGLESADIPRNLYVPKIHALLKNDGIFVITSCNFTTDEIQNHFSKYFNYIQDIKYPVFEFGGSKGSTVCTCIFRKI